MHLLNVCTDDVRVVDLPTHSHFFPEPVFQLVDTPSSVNRVKYTLYHVVHRYVDDSPQNRGCLSVNWKF